MYSSGFVIEGLIVPATLLLRGKVSSLGFSRMELGSSSLLEEKFFKEYRFSWNGVALIWNLVCGLLFGFGEELEDSGSKSLNLDFFSPVLCSLGKFCCFINFLFLGIFQK